MLIQVRGAVYVGFILDMINYAMCEWNCIVFSAFYDVFRSFLDFSQKLPGGVEGQPGDSYVQDPKIGFSSCTAWRQGAARQAIQTGLSSSCGFWVFLRCWTSGLIYMMRV